MDMKKDYILKPFKKNPELENERRKKIEEKIGHTMTDKQWQRYLQMELLNTSRK